MTDGELIGPPAQPGLVLGGRYELVCYLATGGMAQVWEATDQVLHRRVAAKVLHPHLATDQGFLIRFQREAIAAARLSHSSIVGIYDTVTSGGYQAIIMELVDGRTLREVLDDVGRTSHSDAKEIGVQVSNALDEAHRAGVVHRDIKPSNILLCNDHRVMVTDFGIAKAGEDADITAVGTLLGTAKYLSPEQVSGDEVDPRSDLYALGVVLFECLAGVPPFRADTDAATALARLHQPAPRISSINRLVAPEFDELVDRLLECDPSLRFQSASELRTALSGIRLNQGPPPPSLDPTVVEPAGWAGPDPTPTDGGLAAGTEEPVGFIESERSWILPAVVVITVGVALLLAGVLLTGNPIVREVLSPETSAEEPSPTAETTVLTPVQEVSEVPLIRSTQSVDPPPGDGSEWDDRLPLAIDGDDETYWKTEKYRSASFGELKAGVGLLINLESPSVVEEVKIDSPTRGWSMNVYIADSFEGGPESWGDPVAVVDHENRSKTVRFDPVIGSQVLLWITSLGPIDDPASDPGFRFELAEVEIS